MLEREEYRQSIKTSIVETNKHVLAIRSESLLLRCINISSYIFTSRIRVYLNCSSMT